jgi:hypothetical protein
MDGISLYDNEGDRKQHLHAVEMLARDMQTPADRIIVIYERELSKIKTAAKVKDYLTVLVTRRVKDILITTAGKKSF